MEEEERGSVELGRRRFLMLAAALLAGSKTSAKTSGAGRLVDAGPTANYAAEGVYSRFRDEGFFVIRRGAKLIALSAYCTHRGCKVTAEPDRAFYCKCHGSAFDAGGKVTHGPARRDLAVLPSTISPGGHLLVRVTV
jgi:Rieske Fe-S protein